MSPSLRQTSSHGKKATDTTIPATNDNQKIPAKKSSGGKRVCEPEDTIVESEPAPAKKAKIVTKNPDIQPGIRQSGQSPKPNAKAAAEEVKKQKAEEAQEAKQCMAHMDIDDDIDRAQMAAKTIRRLSDMALNNASDLDGEEFVGFNDVSSTSADESEDVEDLKENYRALQKEMEALQQKLGSGGSKKKRTEGGKKRSTRDVAYVSSLLPDWNAHAPKDGSKKSLHGVNINSGGHDNEDADAVNPYSTQKGNHSKAPRKVVEAGKQDLSCQNKLVTIVPEEEIAPIKQNIRLLKSSGRKAVGATKVVPTTIEIKPKSEENVLTCNKTNETKKADETNGKAKKRRVTHTNNVQINDLPDFAKDQTWQKIFLPTLYDKFFTSSNLFSQFAKGSNEFVSLLQVIMKEVYPNIKYKVSASNPIHALAYNRINEKRSTIGSSAINIIKKHIVTLEGAKAIHDWLLWASHGDGPLFFKEPVAPDAPLDCKDPKYVKPGGKLLTKFIIDLVAPFLRLTSGSASSNGCPHGLIALVMAALKCVVQVLLYPSNKVMEFSNGSWGSKVAAYYKNLKNIKETCWKELLDGYGGNSLTAGGANEEYQANLSFLDHNRAMLFDFLSPVKP